MIDRSIKVKKINKPQGRIICISDIHANLDTYLRLLDKVKYKPNDDTLILLGDIIEKGNKNLETLRYIMKQCENEKVHVLMGNCDFVCKNVLYSYRLDFLKHVLSMRKQSIIHEMADSLNLEFSKNTDMTVFNQTLRQHYLKELSFCNDLPHVIEMKDYIFTHAAIMNEEKYGTDFKEVMTTPFFLTKQNHFNKKVVVGHLPVTEYSKTIANFDPIFDAQNNIYAIDGGNVVKQAGQLNALIIDDNKVSIERYDGLKEVKVIKDTNPQNQFPLFITWNHSKIKVIKKTDKQSYVYSDYLKRNFWIENEFIHGDSATDYTNYEMPLNKDEIVKIVFEYQDKVQIKKNGILGWTYRSNLEL